MESFPTLLLRTSQLLGAPCHVARVLGRPPYDVYRWIAGVELPERAEQRDFESRLRAVLHAKSSVAVPWARRSGDRAPGFRGY